MGKMFKIKRIFGKSDISLDNIGAISNIPFGVKSIRKVSLQSKFVIGFNQIMNIIL